MFSIFFNNGSGFINFNMCMCNYKIERKPLFILRSKVINIYIHWYTINILFFRHYLLHYHKKLDLYHSMIQQTYFIIEFATVSIGSISKTRFFSFILFHCYLFKLLNQVNTFRRRKNIEIYLCEIKRLICFEYESWHVYLVTFN